MKNKNFRGKITQNVSSYEDSILDIISNKGGRKNNRNREDGFPAYSWADFVGLKYKRISKNVIRRRVSSD